MAGCGALSQCQAKEESGGRITPVVDAATAAADTDFRSAAKRELVERQPALMLVPKKGRRSATACGLSL